MSLMMVLFWGGVVALVVWLVRRSRTEPTAAGSGSRPTSTGPDEVLAERFARGEIDEDEFSRRRELLHSGGRGGTSSGGASR
ncbi:MAG TPA: SHOCT domain-containing protein [Mycobacteriales bacterium]|nr:SHOCT domain-containing protein [Mycobacteriales bacterium]